jgi:phosphoenolpyruvate carboxykinase (GTP)
VLAWIFRRCDNDVQARATPIGLVPAAADLNLSGLQLAPGALNELLDVDHSAVRAELPQIRQYLARFGERLPAQLRTQLTRTERQLSDE